MQYKHFMNDVCNQIKKDYPDLEVSLEIEEKLKKYTFYINDCFITINDSDLSNIEFDITPEDMVGIIMSDYEFILNRQAEK